MKTDWTKYLLAFFITVAIFGTAFYIASSIDSKRINDIRSTEQNWLIKAAPLIGAVIGLVLSIVQLVEWLG